LCLFLKWNVARTSSSTLYRLRELYLRGHTPPNGDAAINNNDKTVNARFSRSGTSRTRSEREANGNRLDITSREYSREELTVSYQCDTDATILLRRYPRRGGTIKQVAWNRDTTILRVRIEWLENEQEWFSRDSLHQRLVLIVLSLVPFGAGDMSRAIRLHFSQSFLIIQFDTTLANFFVKSFRNFTRVP